MNVNILLYVDDVHEKVKSEIRDSRVWKIQARIRDSRDLRYRHEKRKNQKWNNKFYFECEILDQKIKVLQK